MSITRPQPNVLGTAGEAVERSLQLLREEWRDEFAGRKIDRVRMLLRQAQNLTSDTGLSIALARLDLRLDAYAALEPADRKTELAEIGRQLNELSQRLPKAPGASTKPVAPTRPAPARPTRTAPPRQVSLQSPVTVLPKVGDQVAKKLAKLGLATISDVVRFLPRRHIDYSKTMSIREAVGFDTTGEVTVKGIVKDEAVFDGPPARYTIRLQDSTGSIKVTWFNKYLAHQIRAGDEITISGKLEHGYGMPTATSPEWEKTGTTNLSTGRLTPVYNLTQGVSQKQLRVLTKAALDMTESTVVDYLPEEMRRRLDLMPLGQAYRESHYPSDYRMLTRAHQRLSFDELLLLQLGLVKQRENRRRGRANAFALDAANLDEFFAQLPFQLTRSQRRALEEVLIDLQQPKPMARLLQGDVGSGKTVVAAAAAQVAIRNGFQVAIVAPTEILAEQHLQNFHALFAGLPDAEQPVVRLLTGTTRKKERARLMEELRSGTIDILVGTHALFEEWVTFDALGLVVIDEQHRFGVRQRSLLAARTGEIQPHMLSMTATPIPRTLNMVLNGDLDVSVIDELPPGRIPIETKRFSAMDRQKSWELVRAEVNAGRQAFVICPLVEESETLDAKAAVTEAEFLQREVFPEFTVQVLHGRMSGKEKDRIMEEFRTNESDVLVSTSVIEVGIDIPNASIMLIEGADRFGLAQLHQFRGRIGRGSYQSYCLLLADDATPEAEQRLQIMVDSNDGFVLAQKDLELRGPGDFLGTRQSGLPEMASTIRWFDTRTLDNARREAETILAEDPAMSSDAWRPLRDHAAAFWRDLAPDLMLS
ncbi:MAG TPA: ATP-dependent DNA helicase RecG [Thermomicrobiales bacterium]|nr:ATP-dependent DNA helicase RecG [Thermomicrobiales bacterium]